MSSMLYSTAIGRSGDMQSTTFSATGVALQKLLKYLAENCEHTGSVISMVKSSVS